jgi:hypothetical protein
MAACSSSTSARDWASVSDGRFGWVIVWLPGRYPRIDRPPRDDAREVTVEEKRGLDSFVLRRTEDRRDAAGVTARVECQLHDLAGPW